MTNVKKISRAFFYLALISLCIVCSLGLFGCNNTYSLHNFVDDVRPSAYFKSVDLHLSGDTLSYFRIRLPQNR